MKPIQIHPLSLVVGASLCGLGWLLVGAQQAPTIAGAPTDDRTFAEVPFTISGPVQVEGVPTPAQMVKVQEGNPLAVPADMAFVATGMGTSSVGPSGSTVTIRVNATPILQAYLNAPSSPISTGPSVVPIPPGLVANGGETIDVIENSGGIGVVLGYLADA